MKTGYSYIRFSSVEQSKGDSFRRQTEASTKYAEKHNITPDDTLKLTDLGISAFKGANVEGQLGVFLSAIDSGRVESGSYLLIKFYRKASL
jgi:DNA invertase Pin-like site-specific DNA recombinase